MSVPDRHPTTTPPTATPDLLGADSGGEYPAVPRRVEFASRGWGAFMIAMAGVNGWLAATGKAGDYVEFAQTAYVDLYREAFDTLVAPHPLPWVLALVAFEAGVGAATLKPGRSRRIGLAASAAFVLALTPSNAYTLANPALAAIPAYLLVRDLRARRMPVNSREEA